MATTSVSRGTTAARGSSALTSTAPLRISSGAERNGGMFQHTNPFGRDMAVMTRPAFASSEKKSARVMSMRSHGNLIKSRDIPIFETQKNPLRLHVLTPRSEFFSQDKVFQHESFASLKVIAANKDQFSDSAKLAKVRQNIQYMSMPEKIPVIADNKAPVTVPVRQTVSSEIPMQMPKLARAVQSGLEQKNPDFQTRMLDRQREKFARPQTYNREINSIRAQEYVGNISQKLQAIIPGRQTEKTRDALKQTTVAAQQKERETTTTTSEMQPSTVLVLREYVKLLEELERKKGTSFAQEKAKTLSLNDFVQMARQVLEMPTPQETPKAPELAVKQKPHDEQKTKKQTEDTKPLVRREVDKIMPIIFEQDPKADDFRKNLARIATHGVFKKKHLDRPVSGYEVARLMPYTPHPRDVKSEIIQHLRHGDESYMEVVRQLAKSGTLYSRRHAERIIDDLVARFPAVRLRERLTTRTVTKEDVERVVQTIFTTENNTRPEKQAA